MSKKQYYSSTKSQFVQKQMNEGKTNSQANQAWIKGGDNSPRNQYLQSNSKPNLNSGNLEYWDNGNQWSDYAHSSDDL